MHWGRMGKHHISFTRALAMLICALFAVQAAVDPAVVWAKFASLTEGARLASRQFWP